MNKTLVSPGDRVILTTLNGFVFKRGVFKGNTAINTICVVKWDDDVKESEVFLSDIQKEVVSKRDSVYNKYKEGKGV